MPHRIGRTSGSFDSFCVSSCKARLQFSTCFVKAPMCLIISVTERGIVASQSLLLRRGGSVTRTSIHEYVAAVRARYIEADKQERGRILDEFCAVTGYHRKAACRVLRHPPTAMARRPGQRRRYGLAVLQVLKQVWEVGDRMCSKRLVPFLPELLSALERHGELTVEPAVRAQVCALSPATVDRLLRPHRGPGGRRRPYSQTRATPAVRAQVPIRTWGEWQGVTPGAVQADLVLHCGESTEGFYLTTLTTVDVATGWSVCEAVWGKGKERVGSAVYRTAQHLPFRLRELHTDNGGEFLNDLLAPWCQREGVHLTRGRAYKKNDQAYVEQKNWWVPRRLVGYDRYVTKAAYAQLQRLYGIVRLYVNFFQPLRKVVAKERVGAKMRKRFDRAQTPYQRLVVAEILAPDQQATLARLYESLNPAQLHAEMDTLLDGLWQLAERPRGRPHPETTPQTHAARGA